LDISNKKILSKQSNFHPKLMSNTLSSPKNRIHQRNAKKFLVLVPPILLLLMSYRALNIPISFLSVVTAFSLTLIFPGHLILSIIQNQRVLFRERLAISFVLSLGIWSIPAALLLLTKSSLSLFNTIIITGNIALALIYLVKLKGDTTRSYQINEIPQPKFTDKRISIDIILEICFWLSIAIVIFVFVHFAHILEPSDDWEYVGLIRYYVDTNHLSITDVFASGEAVREQLGSWLVDLALLNSLARVKLMDMYSFYLPPILILLSILAVYTLAKQILKTRRGAIQASLILILYYFSDIIQASKDVDTLGILDKIGMEGGGTGLGLAVFPGRVVQDKYLLLLIVLPVTQTFVFRYITSGKGSDLILLILTISITALIHPLGIVLLGISSISFLFVNYVLSPSRRRFHRAIVLTAFVLLGTLPSFYINYLLKIKRDGIVNEVFSADTFVELSRRFGLLVLSVKQNLYLADPALITERTLLLVALCTLPIILIAYGMRKPSTQFVVTGIIVPLLLAFNPLLVPLLAKGITLRMIWRLYWLLIVPGIFALILSIRFFDIFLHKLVLKRTLLRNIPVAFLITFITLATLSYSDIKEGIKLLSERQQFGISAVESDLFDFLRENVEPNTVVLAPLDKWLNNNIPSMIGRRVMGVSFRNNPPQNYSQHQEFYNTRFLTGDELNFLKEHNVRYIILSKNSLLDAQFDSMQPMFTEFYHNSKFRVYEANEGINVELIQHLLRGNEYFYTNYYQEAQKEFNHAIELNSQNAWANFMLGEIYFVQNEEIKAVQMYKKAAILKPFPIYQIRLVDNQNFEGFKWTQKFPQFTTVIWNNCTDADPLYRPAEWPQVAQIESDLSGCFNSDPATNQIRTELYLRRGNLLIEQQNDKVDSTSYQQALTAFRQAFALAPDDPEVRDALVQAYLALGDQYFEQDLLSQVIAAYEKAVKLDPDNIQVYWKLASVYETLGQMDHAVAVYARIVARWPDRGDAHLRLGQAYEAGGNVEKAVAEYQRAVELEPTLTGAYTRLGNLYRNQDRTEDAIALYRAAARKNPIAAWPHLELGKVYLEQVNAP
jgi:tetratricopeptide (TPR) repeat protein